MSMTCDLVIFQILFQLGGKNSAINVTFSRTLDTILERMEHYWLSKQCYTITLLMMLCFKTHTLHKQMISYDTVDFLDLWHFTTSFSLVKLTVVACEQKVSNNERAQQCRQASTVAKARPRPIRPVDFNAWRKAIESLSGGNSVCFKLYRILPKRAALRSTFLIPIGRDSMLSRSTLNLLLDQCKKSHAARFPAILNRCTRAPSKCRTGPHIWSIV